MGGKKKKMETKIKYPEDMTPGEIEAEARFIAKNAVEIKAPEDNYLEGKEVAQKSRVRGKVVKGGNNTALYIK